MSRRQKMVQPSAGTPFVGRDRELQMLLEALADAASGRGRVVMLGGEPGIGKSRLADELSSRARVMGRKVLWGRGWEDAGAPPYWPWIQALRSHLRQTSREDLRAQVGGGAADLAQMLPELRDQFPDLPPRSESESESARFRLFDSTATLLRNVAGRDPILLVLDDLHAADTPSILLLRFVASQLTDMPVLLLGTYRDIELTPDHPLTLAIAEIAREPRTKVLALPGLELRSVGEVISATANIDTEPHVVAAVWRATGGNPLFVGEAVRLLSAEGRLEDVGRTTSLRVAVPAGVRAVIARRIGHLSDATAGALSLGAVLGPEFGLEVLRLTGEYPPGEALDMVDEAVEAGLLLPVAGGLGRYRFSHDLVRETLYDELSPGRRVRLHRRIAVVLEELYRSETEAHLTELAFHFVAAAQSVEGTTDVDDGIASKAADFARRAGDQAARALAYEEAARLFQMALAVLRVDAGTAEGPRIDLLLALGEAQARAGELDAARATFLEAAGIARGTGARERFARAALGLGGPHPWARQGSDTRLVPLLQEAIEMLAGGSDQLRLRLLTRLACAWRSRPERRGESDTLSAEAVEIARALGDPGSLIYALVGRFWATWWPENPEDREVIARELVRVAEALRDGERIAEAHLMQFLSLLERGRMAEARRIGTTLGHDLEEARQPAQLWLGPLYRAELALIEGDLVAAEALVARELEAEHRFTPARDEVSAARFHRFLLHWAQGRLAEDEEAIRASVIEFPWYPFYRPALAILLLSVGRNEEGRLVFDELAKDGFRDLYRDNEWLLGMSLASEACSMLGSASAAEILYDQLIPFSGRHAIGHPEGSMGAVDRYLGLLAEVMGRTDDAERHLRAASDLNERMGAQAWTAFAQRDLARCLRRRGGRGDRERADRLEEAALATANRLGVRMADTISAGAAHVDDAAPPRSRSESGVFRREGEYWTIQLGRETSRVRDSKGMRHLARLLDAPGRELHALDLVRLASGGASLRPADGARAAAGRGDGLPLLDAEAKAAYRERLEENRVELAEAEAWNDVERAARVRAEQDALIHELSGAVGLGGRDRLAASAAERARLSVTRAIRAALGRIAEQSPTVGAHLGATIRTGTYCSYLPDPRVPIAWQLR